MNVSGMRADGDLPLSPGAVSRHIRRSLVSPASEGKVEVRGIFDRGGKAVKLSQEAAAVWVGELSCQFPARRALENRVFAICVLMTAHLPSNDGRRVCQFGGRRDVVSNVKQG
mmetsp:Transcript_13285/g.19827  ORF Transcript_13285/g.19827 Transcript_13285/m.19827 type:complete len:113 (+) Transcript_13285:3-341(+)